MTSGTYGRASCNSIHRATPIGLPRWSRPPVIPDHLRPPVTRRVCRSSHSIRKTRGILPSGGDNSAGLPLGLKDGSGAPSLLAREFRFAPPTERSVLGPELIE